MGKASPRSPRHPPRPESVPLRPCACALLAKRPTSAAAAAQRSPPAPPSPAPLPRLRRSKCLRPPTTLSRPTHLRPPPSSSTQSASTAASPCGGAYSTSVSGRPASRSSALRRAPARRRRAGGGREEARWEGQLSAACHCRAGGRAGPAGTEAASGAAPLRAHREEPVLTAWHGRACWVVDAHPNGAFAFSSQESQKSLVTQYKQTQALVRTRLGRQEAHECEGRGAQPRAHQRRDQRARPRQHLSGRQPAQAVYQAASQLHVRRA
jgi:hypothetical protein